MNLWTMFMHETADSTRWEIIVHSEIKAGRSTVEDSLDKLDDADWR